MQLASVIQLIYEEEFLMLQISMQSNEWSVINCEFIIIIIIIIIIINEKINAAFSGRTARKRNSHKKTKAAKTSCLTVWKKKK